MACRIDDIFDRLRRCGRTTLIPFVTAGYPSLDATARVLRALEEAGVDIVELGFPFSDPIADGPVIAASMHQALQKGVTPPAIFELVNGLRSQTGLGIVAMVSHSVVRRMGTPTFMADASGAGFDGIIIPDLDLEAAAEESFGDLAAAGGMSWSLLIAPTTGPERLRRLVGLSRGFVYLLARCGITGEQAQAPAVDRRVDALRRHTDLPVAVGFGISRPEHVAAVTRTADAAVVGSALVRTMGEGADPAQSAVELIRTLSTGLTMRHAPLEEHGG